MKKAAVLLIMSFFLLGVSEAKDAEDILERARERYLKFREVATDITMVRTITRRGETIVERRIYKKGEMFRRERNDPENVLIIHIHDGENFWVVVPERGIRQNLFPHDIRRDVLLDDWFNYSDFARAELKFDRVERLGRRDCYVLAGRDKFLWIDTESLALIRVEGEVDEDEKEKFTITFSNFRVIEGWEIPPLPLD